jgi:hypothetical protein
MKLYGKNITENQMLEKTFSTFHASSIVLQQQYKVSHVKIRAASADDFFFIICGFAWFFGVAI